MRVALYARVSTTEQSLKGLSIEAQLAALEEWAKDKTIVDRYVDPGISARKPASKRPELQRLLRDVEAGKVDLIAFTKLDRLTRNVKEYYKVEEVLERHNVPWKAIQEDYETQTASGRFKVNIMLAVAQDEADRTGERVKAVFDRKREKGETCGGITPLGISVVDHRRVANEDADKVRALFRHYLATSSVRATAHASQELTGKAMWYDAVKKMLSNRSYVDTGIIDEKTFLRVQEMRANRSRTPTTGRVYLFSGIARCAACGNRMSACAVDGVKYYRCQKAHNSGSCSNMKYVREDRIEKYAVDNLLSEVKRAKITTRQKTKRVDVEAIRQRMERLNDLYIEGRISKEKYEADYIAQERLLNSAERTEAPPDVKVYSSALDAYNGLSDAGKKAFWLTAAESIVCEDGDAVLLTLRR